MWYTLGTKLSYDTDLIKGARVFIHYWSQILWHYATLSSNVLQVLLNIVRSLSGPLARPGNPDLGFQNTLSAGGTPYHCGKKFNMDICFKWHKGKCKTKYMIFLQNQAMKWRKMDTYSEGRNITRCWILSIFRLLHIILARDIRRIALSCSIILNIRKHWLFHKNVQWYGSASNIQFIFL